MPARRCAPAGACATCRSMTIRHHAGKGGVQPRMLAQEAFARRQYARKHFSPAHRALYLAALRLRYALRRRGWALRALGARSKPPFIAPPSQALAPAVRSCDEAPT